MRNVNEVPIWEKSNLTLEEAAAYSGIGITKLRAMSNDENCQFVLWNGAKRLIKRRELDKYTDKAYSISAKFVMDRSLTEWYTSLCKAPFFKKE